MGILFLIGVFYNSWLMGVVTIAGTLIGTVTALTLKYNRNEIHQGLYDYNSILVALASPKTSEVLKTSPVTVILIYFRQYFGALFLVKTYYLTSHLEKYSMCVENGIFFNEIHEKLQNQDILFLQAHPLCFGFQIYPVIAYVYVNRRIRSHVAKKSFSQSLYPSKRYTIFLPILSI